MNVTITNAPATLKTRIVELCRETYEAHRNQAPQDWPGNFFELLIQPMIEAAFLNSRGNPVKESPTLFVALAGEELAGYYRLSSCPTDPSKEYYAVEMQDIYVLPEYRRKGVGAAMIRHAKGLAEIHDWDTLEANVASWNAGSQQLFEDAGFTVKSQKLSFGPDRAARDIPLPRNSRWRDWLWIAIGAILVAYVLLRFRS